MTSAQIRAANIIYSRGSYRITPTPPTLGRGTRDLGVSAAGAMAEHQVAMALARREELATLGRNLATAGGLAFSYKIGRAHDAFERLGRR